MVLTVIRVLEAHGLRAALHEAKQELSLRCCKAGGAEWALHKTAAEVLCPKDHGKLTVWLKYFQLTSGCHGLPYKVIEHACLLGGLGLSYSLKVSLSTALKLVGKQPNCAMFKAGRRKVETLLLCKEGRLLLDFIQLEIINIPLLL